jgi:integrase/recombinase XerD
VVESDHPMNGKFHEQMTIAKTALYDGLELWIEGFLIDRKAQNLSPKTILFYRERLARLIEFCETQAITQVSHITPDTIRRFMLWLESTGHNAGGQHACYRALRAFILWYWQETDAAGAPPISKVKAPKVALEPLTPVELADVDKLLKVCRIEPKRSDGYILRVMDIGSRDRAIILTLLDTGARASELLSLDLDDIDLVSGSVTIRNGKGSKSRTVFLSQASRRAMRAYLKSRQGENVALFVSDVGDRLTYSGLRLMIERRASQAGIEAPTLHSFRRAFAIGCLRNGMDVFSLQELMGHADLQVLRRYLKQNVDDLRTAHGLGSPVSRLKFR